MTTYGPATSRESPTPSPKRIHIRWLSRCLVLSHLSALAYSEGTTAPKGVLAENLIRSRLYPIASFCGRIPVA